MIKLNLGCGLDIRPKEEGWVNIDNFPYPGVDKILNITVLPLPFESDSIDYVEMNHVIEHIPNWVALIEEIQRILKKDGMLKLKTPHHTSGNAYGDPTHVNWFDSKTFDYFTPSPHVASHPFIEGGRFSFKKNKVRVTLPPLTKWLEPLINWKLGIYETYLCGIIKGNDLEVELIK